MYIIKNIILCFFLTFLSFAQQLYNPNDERFKALYLEKVESDYKLQNEEYERQKILHDKGYISDKEFQISEANFNNAKITYQQAILALAFEQPHIMIDKAVKMQSKDGTSKVKLILKNTTSGIITSKRSNLNELVGINTDRISNVYISLQNEVNAIISQPYEKKIPEMFYNKPVTIDFVLLQDLDYVTVSCVYGDKKEQHRILLQKDDSASKVIINSEQYSQTGNLGSKIVYQLMLNLYTGSENIFKLECLNLPDQISYDFVETSSGAKISQIVFSQNITRYQMSLTLYLPDQSDSLVQINKPIEFFVVALPTKKLRNVKGNSTNQAELEKDNIGFSQLELIPKGVGKLGVTLSNLYFEMTQNEDIDIPFSILNEGTRRLNNVKINIEIPQNWKYRLSMETLRTLDPNGTKNINLKIIPPYNITIGDYEATIKVESLSDNLLIKSDEKKLRIHISSESNSLMIVALVIILLGAVLGIVYYGIKLSKR